MDCPCQFTLVCIKMVLPQIDKLSPYIIASCYSFCSYCEVAVLVVSLQIPIPIPPLLHWFLLLSNKLCHDRQ